MLKRPKKTNDKCAESVRTNFFQNSFLLDMKAFFSKQIFITILEGLRPCLHGGRVTLLEGTLILTPNPTVLYCFSQPRLHAR